MNEYIRKMKLGYSINNEDGEDIVYINVQATNESKEVVPMICNINRSSYIIRNPQEYQLSLVRFQIPTMTLPLWFFNPNITYSVTMNFNGSFSTVPLIYINTNPGSNYTNGIWSYSDLCDIINSAISIAFAPLSVLVGFPAAFPPYIQYESTLKCFSIVGENAYNDIYPYTTALVPHLFFNQNLFNLFNNFKGISFGILPTGRDNLIAITALGNNKVTTKDSLPGLSMTQEYSTLFLINSLSSIAITSNDLPIVSLNQAQVPISGNATSSTYLQLVEDFQPIISGPDTAGDQRSIILYQPSIFRYTTMLGSSEVKGINLEFYAYLADQNIYQRLFLSPQQYLSLRLMFKRKKLNF